MIKLIASDMDGTLFAADGTVPEETFDLIRELAELGVHFATSSGRSYALLHDNNFAPVADCMDFIASNGLEVYAGDVPLVLEQMSREAIRRIADFTNLFPDHHLMLASDNGVYVCDDSQEKLDRLMKDLEWAEAKEGNLAITLGVPEPGVRITTAWFATERPDEMADFAYIANLELGDIFTFNYTSIGMDLSPKGITKATGMKSLMRHYGLTPDEVVVYGDSMNDYEILRAVGHPVVMGNGFYAVKQIAERVIETNVEHGVQHDLCRIIDDIRSGGDGCIDFGNPSHLTCQSETNPSDFDARMSQSGKSNEESDEGSKEKVEGGAS